MCVQHVPEEGRSHRDASLTTRSSTAQPGLQPAAVSPCAVALTSFAAQQPPAKKKYISARMHYCKALLL